MRLIASRYVLAVRVAAVGAALCLPAACDSAKDTLLDAPIPTVIDPSAVQSADGAEALRIGAIGRLRQITAGSGAGDSPWMFVRNLSELAFDRMSTEGAVERLGIGLGVAAPVIGALVAATGTFAVDDVAAVVADRDAMYRGAERHRVLELSPAPAAG